MKLRCDLHVNGGVRKLIIIQGPNEKEDHLALKLAAFILFWDFEPIVGASPKHPALLNQEFIPDLLAIDDAGQAKLWIECGQTSMNKLMKLTRRFPQARLVVLRESPREAQRLRRDMVDQLDRHEKVEVLAWAEGGFKTWLSALQEKTEVYGEAGGLTINVVANEVPVVAEFTKY